MVAYSEFGVDVIAMDISTGRGPTGSISYKPTCRHPPRPSKPRHHPFSRRSPSYPRHRTFEALRPLLRPGGTLYVWLYCYERLVTLTVNFIRRGTSRIPPHRFARVADAMAGPFQVFCRVLNAAGVRSYPALQRREAALALLDIFGAPYCPLPLLCRGGPVVSGGRLRGAVGMQQ